MRRIRMLVCSSAVAAGLGLAGLCSAANAPAAGTAEANWTAITACSSKPDERSRHACIDDVLRQAGVLSAERQEKEKRARFGVEPPPAPTRTPDASAAEPVENQVEVKLAAVTVTPDAKLIVRTTDGVTWIQRDSDAVRPTPAAGDTMTIRRAMLGSFICSVRGSDAFRCSRAR